MATLSYKEILTITARKKNIPLAQGTDHGERSLFSSTLFNLLPDGSDGVGFQGLIWQEAASVNPCPSIAVTLQFVAGHEEQQNPAIIIKITIYNSALSFSNLSLHLSI